MSGSTFGKLFRCTTAGESHGESMCVIIDGCPSGIELSVEDISNYLAKRKPSSIASTSRGEDDIPKIVSGIYNGKTLGTPICILIPNKKQQSEDYNNLKNVFRPSHADICYYNKYGTIDFRGGGRSSGRETICRVACGAVAKAILNKLNITTLSYVNSIKDIYAENIDLSILPNEFNFPDKSKIGDIKNLIKKIKNKNDSIGGSIKTIVKGLPFGIGEPVFRKLDAELSKAIMSIGGSKAIEFGAGIKSSQLTGSEYNDEIEFTKNVNYLSNNSGGVLGGISNSDEIHITTWFKPTPSINIPKKTITTSKQNTILCTKGRHDICYLPRVNVVVESMVNITIVDLLLENMTSNIENIIKIYKK